MTLKVLGCHAKSEHFKKKLSHRFVLNETLLIRRVDAESCQSVLLRMPYELLLLIFDTVGHAPSQVALALSCKHLALVARSVNLARATTSAKYAGFLPRDVFDVPILMKQLSPWMPKHLRLCDHCLTARPCKGTYWQDVEGCAGSGDFWITKTGWSFSDASWHKQVHNICPSCHISCSLSDYVDCDGCRALGRLGDVDWHRVSDHWRRRTEGDLRAGIYAT